jgi:RNA:NAD 2'-phosphotransferase (TPT1/KptA family)
MAQLFYHTTIRQRLRSIRRHGLCGGRHMNYSPSTYAHSRFAVYLFKQARSAMEWGWYNMRPGKPYARIHIIEVELPDNHPVGPDTHGDFLIAGKAVWTSWSIPPSAIRRVGELLDTRLEWEPSQN